MERFYVAPAEIGDGIALVTGAEWQHLAKVLRLKPGDGAEIFDGRGRGYVCIVEKVEVGQAVLSLRQPVTEPRDSSLVTCLAQGIPKGEKMEWIVQKACELGVSMIQPLALQRCVVRLTGEKKILERQKRWQKVAQEAARQCGRLEVPEVLPPLAVEDFIAGLTAKDLLLIPWEEGGQPLQQLFRTVASPAGTVYLMIGPEGGMTAEEVEQGVKAGGQPLTLGPRILRTETAGLMLLSVLQYQWGDAGGRPSSHFASGDRD